MIALHDSRLADRELGIAASLVGERVLLEHTIGGADHTHDLDALVVGKVRDRRNRATGTTELDVVLRAEHDVVLLEQLGDRVGRRVVVHGRAVDEERPDPLGAQEHRRVASQTVRRIAERELARRQTDLLPRVIQEPADVMVRRVQGAGRAVDVGVDGERPHDPHDHAVGDRRGRGRHDPVVVAEQDVLLVQHGRDAADPGLGGHDPAVDAHLDVGTGVQQA